MKPYTYSLLAAALACGMAQGAATAYTTPVGYITTPINGNTASNPSGAATYVSAPLVQPDVFAGATTVSPSGSNVATFSGSVPTTLDTSYVLEITSGPSEGWWTTVTSSTATSITVNDNFPAGLSAGEKISVRKHNTLLSVFGANTPGLKVVNNTNSPPYDTIEVLNPLTQATTVAVYVLAEVGVAADGWYDFVSQAPLNGFVIEPGTAVKVVRQDASGLSLVSSGTVKTTKTQVDVFPNFNWLGQTLATGGTLGSMSFYNQIVKFDNGVTSNDFISLLNPDQSSDVFVAADPTLGIGSIMANFVTAADATNEPIGGGEGYVFQRGASTPASVITIPAQTVAP
jgi:hypothetical protein